MASITGLSNQNYVSSLYNSSKTISGLATGMDTESMIEGLTQSYQAKITQLQQKSTKVEWKQEAYRSMIAKMSSYSNKYTSYTSSTNLMSQSFWNSARTSSVSGTNSSKVSASGTTTSDIKLNSVSQLATAARYSTAGNFGNVDGKTITGESVDLTEAMNLSTLQGTLSFTYGNKLVSVSFSESDQIELKTKEDGTTETKAEALARVINEKLADETITLSDGSSVAASERISVTADANGNINLADKSSAGNSVYLSGASGTVGTTLGLGDLSDTEANKSKKSFKVSDDVKLTTEVDPLEKMSGKSMNVNLNGTIKKITLPTVKKNEDGSYTIGDQKNVAADKVADVYADALNKSLQKEFGDKVEVKNTGKDGELKLEFSLKNEGDELLINSDAGDALGIGKVASNYLSTGKTLKELGFTFDPADEIKDENGNGTGKYKFSINGKDIGEYDENTTLSTIMSDINSKSDVKVSYSKTSREFVFTSKETGKNTKVEFGGAAQTMFGTDHSGKKVADVFKDVLGDDFDGTLKDKTFTLKVDGKEFSFDFKSDTGNMDQLLKKINDKLNADGLTASYSAMGGGLVVKDSSGQEKKVEFDDSDAGKAFKKMSESYTAGKDAEFQVEVNGRTMNMTRSDNKVEIDGLTINFKGTFDTKDGDEAVTFQNEIKSDKVVDEVKNMIAELNVLLAEARGAYANMPNQKSDGSMYEPLTDEDMSSMSETAIKNYEEKAKQGLLFADSNISGLYNNIVNVFNRAGMDRTMMDKMGIGLSYDTNGAATITLDESKFKEALESDFDGVVDMFTRTKENGAASDGIMQGIKTQMDRYGATTGAVKGILVQQAGTPLASLTLLDNAWQKEIDSFSEQITKWQEKLEKQVDKYTKLFTRLETLTNQMNSQSSALAGLMGG